MPAAAARASKNPTATNGAFGMESISSVTLPEWYRRNSIEKYTTIYLQKKKSKVKLNLQVLSDFFLVNLLSEFQTNNFLISLNDIK